MSHEVELKFRIPPERLAALRRAVATASARRVELAASYVDTPARDLSRARGALRLRREDHGQGGRWVQTLKAEGRGPLERLEDDQVLQADEAPIVDPDRHAGTLAGVWLARVLATAADATLVERYATRIVRTQRLLRSGGAVVELALDEGEITAAGGARRQPVLELEMELKHGPVQAMLALAARWVERFGLVLDTRSKSEAGHLLAEGRAVGAPAKARPLPLPPGMARGQALAALLSDPLRQALANASVLSDGHGGAEHLHQLRVGLRRLRSVLRLYGQQASDGLPGWSPDWSARLAALFASLGAQRDADVMAEQLWPALRAAGAPWVGDGPAAEGIAAQAEGPPAGGQSGDAVVALLRQPATQQLWLELLGASAAPDLSTAAAPAKPDDDALDALLAAPQRALWRQIRRDATRFAALDDDARHRLRRRIKRLRYVLESTATRWRARRTRDLLAALAQAQTVLGDFNDTVSAGLHYRRLAAQDGRAWFAVGWLAARRIALEAPCAKALAALARARPPWPSA